MTIDLPVLLWTVINFFLTVLLLQHLLFKPLLAHMDARQARIDAAAAKKAEHAAALAEAQKQAEALEADAARHRAEKASAALAEAQADARMLLEVTHKKQAQESDLALAALDAEAKELEAALDAGADRLCEAFASALIAG